MQHPVSKTLDEAALKYTNKRALERIYNQSIPKYQKISHSVALEDPIGFKSEDDKDTMAKRIEASKETEFNIERKLFCKRNRFVPIGSSTSFYKDTMKFYSTETSLSCWWCTEPCNCVPIPHPQRYSVNKQNTKDVAFYVMGIFCSSGCMLAYAKTQKSCVATPRFMLKHVYGVPISCDKTVPAPDRHSLKKFGGHYTIEEFRGTSRIGIKTEYIQLPFIPFNAGITELDRIQTTVTEKGGKKLAMNRIKSGACIRTGFGTPIHNQTKKQTQEGKFTNAPTIQEQIAASDRKLRLQMQPFHKDKKRKKTLKDFMRLKEKDADEEEE